MADFSEALKEAYASSPVGEIILETLEFLHPAFINDDGNPDSIRIVHDGQDLFATLEPTAPLHPGASVQFQAFAFDVTLPGFEEGQTPTMTITVDNVGRELTRELEAATASIQPITVIHRIYLISDLSGPQMDPPIQMTVQKATVDLNHIAFTCTLDDVTNVPFPRRQYTPDDFPGLVR